MSAGHWDSDARRYVPGGKRDPDAFQRDSYDRRHDAVAMIQEAEPQGRGPSRTRSALARGPDDSADLNDAAELYMKAGALHPANAEGLSRMIAERRAEFERAGGDTSDPLTNARITADVSDEVEEEAESIRYQRESEAAREEFADWCDETYEGGREAVAAWLREQPDYERAVEQLVAAYQYEHPGAVEDAGDIGEAAEDAAFDISDEFAEGDAGADYYDARGEH